MLAFQSVEDLETGTKRDPVYSYTRQQLTGTTIKRLNPGLYKLMEELQKDLSLFAGGLDPTQEEYLKPSCCDISVLAAIPSNSVIPR